MAQKKRAASSQRRGSRSPTGKRRAGGPAKRTTRSTGAKKWSAQVMKRSDAMDLESGVFKKRSAREVAASLKRSAEASKRRKSPPFRSAMSMLNFEINRGGKGLTPERRRVLNRAKTELRKAFGRPLA